MPVLFYFLKQDDNDFLTQTTLTTLPLTATVFYQYHPLFGQTFKVQQRSGGQSGRLILELENAKTLAIPQWMLDPKSSQYKVHTLICLQHSSLQKVIDLLDKNAFTSKHILKAPENHYGST